MPPLTLFSLHEFPVKACRGLDVDSAPLDRLGLTRDRRLMLVDASGRFISQRSHPQLAAVVPTWEGEALTLHHADQTSLAVPAADSAGALLRTVSVWSSHDLLADDCGPACSAWFSTLLGEPIHLVRMGHAFDRPVRSATAQPGDAVSFADGYPLLIAGTASLAELNRRLPEPIPMARFRPNLVIETTEPFVEDTWTRIRIGDAILRAAGPCARCIVTTLDPLTGDRRGPEPLRTLAQFRRDPTDPSNVNFGQNYISETAAATLHIGQPVEVIS